MVAAAWSPPGDEERPIALVDIGTGAGLGLHLDRYRYLFHGPGNRVTAAGDPASAVVVETEVRGPGVIPLANTLPTIADRVGIDIEPLDPSDPRVFSWLAACVPQEVGAVTRFHRAVEVALANPTRSVRGDAAEILPELLAALPEDL